MSDSPTRGSLWEYKGVMYQVIRTDEGMMVQRNDQWEPVVIYHRKSVPLTFVRAKSEFLEKFRSLDDDSPN
jgi:hypothetical protein